MKSLLVTLCAATMILACVCAVPAAAQDEPTVSINVLNPAPNGVLVLDVGESYTFDIEVTSDTPFLIAIALTDAYYPGRGVKWHGVDVQQKGTSALLHLTVTGKNSTADLLRICDWPEPDICYPDGVAPLAIAAGARFPGFSIGEYLPFSVRVP
mgnify:CR=1 FL=1